MPDQLPQLAERVLLGRYRLVRLIAQGGMAEVWEGHDQILARPVAVKVLHGHLADDAAFVERFRREAVAAAGLVHPGIVSTYDTGSDEGVAFIVMELVRGATLRQTISDSAPLPAAVAVPIAAEVADALDYAHRAGLVHRDVKPANILVTEHAGATAPLLAVKVADFGIAKLDQEPPGQALTEPGAVVGTATYLSPEQVEGSPADARTDEYALGVVLYEMLCGAPPFQAETDLATALHHLRTPAPPLRQHQGGISPALEAVVLKALAKDPDERYPSLAAMRDALLAVDASLDGADGGPVDDAVPLVVRHATPPAGVPP
ncbi:MAG: protein kinase domain-containing protein, partial [Acidimicrobiales bacterium]